VVISPNPPAVVPTAPVVPATTQAGKLGDSGIY